MAAPIPENKKAPSGQKKLVYIGDQAEVYVSDRTMGSVVTFPRDAEILVREDLALLLSSNPNFKEV